jgi:hypothetical protein
VDSEGIFGGIVDVEVDPFSFSQSKRAETSRFAIELTFGLRPRRIHDPES